MDGNATRKEYSYLDENEPQQDIMTYEKQLKLSREKGDLKAQATALDKLGRVYAAWGKPQRAVDYYQQAQTLAHQSGESLLECAILSNLGQAYDNTDQISLALHSYKQALLITRGERAAKGELTTTPTYKDPDEQRVLSVPSSASSTPTKGQRRQRILRLIFLPFILAVMFSSVAYLLIKLIPISQAEVCNPNMGIPPTRICTFQAANGENVGISNGQSAFDISRDDGVFKNQASEQFKAGNIVAANDDWQKAQKISTNDAEVLIYLEDQQVLNSQRRYVTFVVATVLSGNDDSIAVGQSDLQGAYLAQKEYNEQHSVQIRLLIANFGSQSADAADTIANQIVQVSRTDSTLIGVIDFPSNTSNALQVLSKAHILVVTPTPTGDPLPYVFHVAPSIEEQANAGVLYARNTLHAKTAVTFYDPSDPYSLALEEAFVKDFRADGNQVMAKEIYTIGQPEALLDLIHAVLEVKPDLIYFTGSSSDAIVLIDNISALPNNPSFKVPNILGGHSLYSTTQQIFNRAPANFNLLHFTVSADSNIWDHPDLAPQKPSFFTQYRQVYGPGMNDNIPGFTRPDSHAILSYDAALVLLKGYDIAFNQSRASSITSANLVSALTAIKSSQAIPGASGQIEFDSRHDPVNKFIGVLSFDDGMIQVTQISGTLLKSVNKNIKVTPFAPSQK